MAEIKPAEVSAILRQQLAGFRSEAELDEKGTVLQVGDGIARIYGLNNVQAGELVEFESTGIKGIVLNLEEDNVGVVMLGEESGINEGDEVKRTRSITSIRVSEGMLGRVINTVGDPIDGNGRLPARCLKCRWSARLPVLFSGSRLVNRFKPELKPSTP